MNNKEDNEWKECKNNKEDNKWQRRQWTTKKTTKNIMDNKKNDNAIEDVHYWGFHSSQDFMMVVWPMTKLALALPDLSKFD